MCFRIVLFTQHIFLWMNILRFLHRFIIYDWSISFVCSTTVYFNYGKSRKVYRVTSPKAETIFLRQFFVLVFYFRLKFLPLQGLRFRGKQCRHLCVYFSFRFLKGHRYWYKSMDSGVVAVGVTRGAYTVSLEILSPL